MRALARQGKRTVNVGTVADPALHVPIDLVRRRGTVFVLRAYRGHATTMPTHEGGTSCSRTRRTTS